MAQIVKTPVMVLQELATKRGVAPPVYDLVPEQTKQGTHSNEFCYQVEAFEILARGRGSSKQIAKHDAAKNMLNLLQQEGIYLPSENPVQGFVPGSAQLSRDPIKTSVNCIGNLCLLCEENNIPQPQFIEISDVGPPHCRQFTYDCIVASVRTRAIASTKKQAKQLAAKDMLERIKDILPELVQECNSTTKSITEISETVINLFYNLSTTSATKKPDYCSQVKDYNLVFKKIMEEKGITLDNFKDYISDEYTEENFNAILEKLDLVKTYVTLQCVSSGVLVVLTLSTNPPQFSTMGQGKTEDEAKYLAGKDAYHKMISWMK